MKRISTIVALIAILISQIIYSVFAASPGYNKASSWAVPELEKAEEYGLITDKIREDMSSPITREEFAEIAVKLYEKSTGTTAATAAASTFKDTKNPEVLKAFNLKIVNGTDTRKSLFSPNQLINREQIAAMMFRAVKAINPGGDFSLAGAPAFKDERYISDWALESVKFMSANGFMVGSDGRFDPKGNCTREMAVIIAERVFEKYGQPNSSESGSGQESSTGLTDYYIKQVIVNDYTYGEQDYRIIENEGKSYIFINAEKLKFGLKRPYAGYFTYPDMEIDNGSVVASWNNENGVILSIKMTEGSTEAVRNNRPAKAGMAPFREYGKLFVPLDIFISALEMDIEYDELTYSLMIQYKKDFPAETLVGSWSYTSTDLFVDFEDLTSGSASLPTFATAYLFEKDGTYRMRMLSTGGSNDTAIDQYGRYKIMGNTIMFHDIVETLYKGSPFNLVYKEQQLEAPRYIFIGNYDPAAGKIELDGFWLSKRKQQ